MRDDERYIIDGLDLRDELDRLAALPVFHGAGHDLVTPTLRVRRTTRQPRRLGFARGGHLVSVSFVRSTTTHDRFDALEVLMHELTHIWFQQLDIDERVGHSSKFWNLLDLVFGQATGIDPRSLPPRRNMYHGRYAAAMRRAALVTHGEELTGDIDRVLVEAAQVPREDVPPLELRGSSWDDVQAALRAGRAVQLPSGKVRSALTFAEFHSIVERDDRYGRWTPFIDPNEPRELTAHERAFLAGELDDRGYTRPVIIDLPEPLKSLPEPEEVPGGRARVTSPEYAPDHPRRRPVDAPRLDDRYSQPLPVEDRVVTRGWYNVDRRDRDVLRALRTQGPMTARELAAYLHITDGQARHATARLRRKGKIEKPYRGAPWRIVNVD